MLGNDENGKQFFSKLLPDYKKAVMWMPTYRKSIRSYLNEDTLVSPFDIPLMYCRKDWMNLDTFCRRRGILRTPCCKRTARCIRSRRGIAD